MRSSFIGAIHWLSNSNFARILSCILLLCVFTFPNSLSNGEVLTKDTEFVSCYPTFSNLGRTPLSFSHTESKPELEIWFGRVSCCDAFVLRCNGETMLIDGGARSTAKASLDFINKLGLTEVDYIFNTHHDDDHLEMQYYLVTHGFKAKVFLTPYGHNYPNNLQRLMEAAVYNAGIEYRTIGDGNQMHLGGEDGALIEFFRWGGSTNPNFSSVMCKITYGKRTCFLMADVISAAQKALAVERPDIPWKSDILKVGHHGYTVQDKDLLKMISPELCIIPNSPMGGSKTVEQCKRLGYPYLITNLGTVYLHTDGGDCWYYYQDKTHINK